VRDAAGGELPRDGKVECYWKSPHGCDPKRERWLNPPASGCHYPRVVASRTAQAASIRADMKACDIAASASCGPIATINFFVARRTEG